MITNPWILLGATLAFLAALTGSYLKGHSNGVDHERGVWVQKENKALADANKRILDLNEQARAQESLNAVKLNTISSNYQQELKTHDLEKDRIIADIKSHTLILRDPGISTQGSGSEASAASASSSGCDGGKESGLSATTGEFLVSLASEADAVVKQLSACQQVVIEDRKLSN